MTIELNNTNCREYTESELKALLGVETIEVLTKKLKANIAKLKKVEYKSDEYKSLATEQLEIKTVINDNYGRDVLVQILIGKKRTDGKFKQLNSKGNGYGNM